MQTIITNKYSLNEEDMTEVVKRVKNLIINSNREILEETEIVLNIKDLVPFACAFGYYKDWPEEGKNRKTEIYYYEVKTDEKPNLSSTKYTKSEKEGGFELRYIPLSKVEEVLLKNAKTYGDEKGITSEMLNLFCTT